MTDRRQTPTKPLMPNPPQWALDAGLPQPDDDETFEEYVTRLGYDCSELLADLTPRTYPVAHVRLLNKLIESLPVAWQQHLTLFVKAHARQSTL